MCRRCWENKYGAPVETFLETDSTPNFFAVLESIASVYKEDSVCGALHVQLVDWNLEDEHFNIDNENQIKTDVERRCFDLMKSLTLRQRAAVLGFHNKYWECNQREKHRLYLAIGLACPCNR